MNYYTEIKNKLIENENYSRIKDYSKERYKILNYYEVGKILSEAGKHYGDGIIKQYSVRLTSELGKGYSKRNLWLMLKFYETQEKVQTLSAQLSWSHYCEIISMESVEKIKYYISLCESQNLSVRELRKRIKNQEFERLPEETKQKLIIEKNESKISDLIKNPIIIRNSNNIKITEKNLQQIILEDLPSFLKELGNGFSFIENEYKIKM